MRDGLDVKSFAEILRAKERFISVTDNGSFWLEWMINKASVLCPRRLVQLIHIIGCGWVS